MDGLVWCFSFSSPSLFRFHVSFHRCRNSLRIRMKIWFFQMVYTDIHQILFFFFENIGTLSQPGGEGFEKQVPEPGLLDREATFSVSGKGVEVGFVNQCLNSLLGRWFIPLVSSFFSWRVTKNLSCITGRCTGLPSGRPKMMMMQEIWNYVAVFLKMMQSQRVCFFFSIFLVLSFVLCQVQPTEFRHNILLGCSVLQDPEKYGLVNRSFNLVVPLGNVLWLGGSSWCFNCKFVCRSWMVCK